MTISSAESEEEEGDVEAEDDEDVAASTSLLRRLSFVESLGWFDTARGTSYGHRATGAAAVVALVPPGELWKICLSCVSATALLLLMPATLTTEAKNSRFMGRLLLRAMEAIFIASSYWAAREQRTTCTNRTMVDFRSLYTKTPVQVVHKPLPAQFTIRDRASCFALHPIFSAVH